jgi:pyridoxine/pyridoxamine 5'-phosphate oxidase
MMPHMTLLRTSKAKRGRIAHAYQFLQTHPAGVLATVGPNGEPHGAVIYFGVNPSLIITFLTKHATRKSSNLAVHNHAMLTVFDEKLQSSIQISGIVSAVTNETELSTVYRDTLRASLHHGKSAVPPVMKIPGGFIAYRLTPVQVRISSYLHTYLRNDGDIQQVIDLPVKS